MTKDEEAVLIQTIGGDIVELSRKYPIVLVIKAIPYGNHNYSTKVWDDRRYDA